MNRITALACAALLLGACAKDGGRSAAAASDSAANAAAAEAPAPAAPATPTGIGGVPAYARQGVDSSNAAQQQRLDQVNELSDQASGAKQP
ncbi:MAG TPA: hypothetical protein VGO40_03700 [Longimicrobium sp.]|jgi:hypothetical protein|nr:hypothetical protein [Longimicrobium sp.]